MHSRGKCNLQLVPKWPSERPVCNQPGIIRSCALAGRDLLSLKNNLHSSHPHPILGFLFVNKPLGSAQSDQRHQEETVTATLFSNAQLSLLMTDSYCSSWMEAGVLWKAQSVPTAKGEVSAQSRDQLSLSTLYWKGSGQWCKARGQW